MDTTGCIEDKPVFNISGDGKTPKDRLSENPHLTAEKNQRYREFLKSRFSGLEDRELVEKAYGEIARSRHLGAYNQWLEDEVWRRDIVPEEKEIGAMIKDATPKRSK